MVFTTIFFFILFDILPYERVKVFIGGRCGNSAGTWQSADDNSTADGSWLFQTSFKIAFCNSLIRKKFLCRRLFRVLFAEDVADVAECEHGVSQSYWKHCFDDGCPGGNDKSSKSRKPSLSKWCKNHGSLQI